MKRKIFSTLLFGALAFVSLSTVTSCKDYDDDINNLQGQIDKMALKTDVEALKSQVEANKSAAESALASAKADIAANKDAIAKVEEVAKKAGADVAGAVSAAAKAGEDAAAAAAAAKKAQETADAAVKTASDNSKALEEIGKWQATVVTTEALSKELDDLLTKINEATEKQVEELTKLVKAFDGAINALYSAVTEVSLVGSFTTTDGFTTGTDLTVEAGTVAANYVFGEKDKDDKDVEHSATPTKKYTEGDPFGFANDFLIRVNPVNATVTKDMIKFIDSQGNDLDDLFEVANVKKYDELLTRGSGNATGLWVVTAKPKKNVDDTNKGVTKDQDKTTKILYAVAINNTADQAEAVEDAADRYVVSTYDLTFNATDWKQTASLHEVKIYSEKTMGEPGLALNNLKNRDSKYQHKTSANQQIIPAMSGENIVLDFSAISDKAEWFYVVRDDSHAGDDKSDNSEINAWNTYKYEGLNQVYSAKDGGKIKVTIPADVQAGDEIAFRVFAIGYDGQLLVNGGATEPEVAFNTGHSFCVYVAAENTNASVTGDILALEENKAESGWLPLAGSLSDNGTALFGYNIKAEKSLKITLNVTKKEPWNVTVLFAKDANGTPAEKNSDIKYAMFTSADAMTGWTDGATNSGIHPTKDSKGNIANILNISLTKKLPDLAYTLDKHKYSWKANQKVNGVFTAYLYNKSDGSYWGQTAYSDNGYKEMNAVLNGFKGTRYEYVVEKAKKAQNNADKKFYFTDTIATKGNISSVMKVDNIKDASNVLLIDNATEHASRIQYNYGLISSVKVNDKLVDYCIVTEEFKTVFACPLNTNVQKFNWEKKLVAEATSTTPAVYADMNVITYGVVLNLAAVQSQAKEDRIATYLKATNSYDSKQFDGAFNTIYEPLYSNWGATVKLISNESGNEDYYKVSITSKGNLLFEPAPDSSNPTADVPSTLVLTLKDAFGHENVYKLPFTVKQRVNQAN